MEFKMYTVTCSKFSAKYQDYTDNALVYDFSCDLDNFQFQKKIYECETGAYQYSLFDLDLNLIDSFNSEQELIF
jgi:hypothetical protein